MGRRRVIGVMGSGQDPHAALTEPLGRLIAEGGFHLLTGGGAGVMASVSEAFVAVAGRGGLCLGILKGSVEEGRYRSLGGPNPFVELAVRTHLPDSGLQGKAPSSRNHLNVLTADALVVLPGGPGTQSELELAIQYERPVRVFAREGDRIGTLRVSGEELDVGGQVVPVSLTLGALRAFLESEGEA